jgi:two-component system chemotaxis response regulator CheY
MGKRILIVDDSSIMRKMIRKTLEPHGHDIVGEAKNGEEAVALYQRLRPDLVTMDITMRGMDGFTAAKEILKFDDSAQIVFLSHLHDEKYSEDALRLGAIGYINKHKSQELLNIIDND